MLYKRQSHIYHNLKVRLVSVAPVVKVKVNTDQLRCWLAGQCVFLSRLLKDRVLPPADKTFHLATKGWALGFELRAQWGISQQTVRPKDFTPPPFILSFFLSRHHYFFLPVSRLILSLNQWYKIPGHSFNIIIKEEKSWMHLYVPVE